MDQNVDDNLRQGQVKIFHNEARLLYRLGFGLLGAVNELDDFIQTEQSSGITNLADLLQVHRSLWDLHHRTTRMLAELLKTKDQNDFPPLPDDLLG